MPSVTRAAAYIASFANMWLHSDTLATILCCNYRLIPNLTGHDIVTALGEHLIIQLVDCLDVIKGIYKDEYIIHFMVNHSCGHNRQRKDGINEKDMNVNGGGTSK